MGVEERTKGFSDDVSKAVIAKLGQCKCYKTIFKMLNILGTSAYLLKTFKIYRRVVKITTNSIKKKNHQS